MAEAPKLPGEDIPTPAMPADTEQNLSATPLSDDDKAALGVDDSPEEDVGARMQEEFADLAGDVMGLGGQLPEDDEAIGEADASGESEDAPTGEEAEPVVDASQSEPPEPAGDAPAQAAEETPSDPVLGNEQLEAALAHLAEPEPQTPEPQAPAPQAPQPQAQQFQPLTAERIEEMRQENLKQLETRYKLNETDVETFYSKPEEVVPKLLAQAHQNAMTDVMRMLPAYVAQHVQNQADTTSEQQRNQELFFSGWPNLKQARLHPKYGEKVRDVLNRISHTYWQQNPDADMETAFSEIGTMARV